jgi:hypothetical protein
MAKDKSTDVAVELSVEGLMAIGFSQADAQTLVGANKGGGGSSLPFPALKINYDRDMELANFGEWISDIQKDDKGNVTGVTVLGGTINLIVLASDFQYSKYDSTTQKSVVSSNIFPLTHRSSAFDLSSGVSVAELKKDDVDDKIKLQEIMLVLAWSELSPTPKPYILYSKGAFMYTFNQKRKTLPKNGSILYTMSLTLDRQKNGSTVYFTVNPDTFVGTLRSMKELSDSTTTTPQYIKAYNDWVASVNSGGTPKAGSSAPKDYVTDDDDDIKFD